MGGSFCFFFFFSLNAFTVFLHAFWRFSPSSFALLPTRLFQFSSVIFLSLSLFSFQFPCQRKKKKNCEKVKIGTTQVRSRTNFYVNFYYGSPGVVSYEELSHPQRAYCTVMLKVLECKDVQFNQDVIFLCSMRVSPGPGVRKVCPILTLTVFEPRQSVFCTSFLSRIFISSAIL